MNKQWEIRTMAKHKLNNSGKYIIFFVHCGANKKS